MDKECRAIQRIEKVLESSKIRFPSDRVIDYGMARCA